MTEQVGSPARRMAGDPREAWRALAARIRPVLGWVLAGAGFVAILVGWLGVSREALVARQLPYLISGGLAGLALVILGAVVLGVDDLRRSTRRLDDVEQQVGDLHRLLLVAADDLGSDAPGGDGDSRPTAPGAAGDATAPRAAGVVALPDGQSYHLAGCTVVRGKRVRHLGADRAAGLGLTPCKLCEPAGGRSGAAAGT